jgi:poly(3-hydroxybutyrate) depolymerase
MRWLFPLAALVVCASAHAGAALATRAVRLDYRAHDGRTRPAWLLLPKDYDGQSIPLVISPHGRGVSARANARFWGNLPGEGDFAVVNPGGEGRRLADYSWGDPGQIDDLARMPEIVERHGVTVDLHRVYAVGGSMGGQETLLLVARHPGLLAGAVAFDPATDMARRYRDFATMRHGARLRELARDEIGGTPSQAPTAYLERSPDAYVDAIAFSGVSLQIYWRATGSTPRRCSPTAGCHAHWRGSGCCALGARRRRAPDERGLEVGEQVLAGLDPDRQPNEVAGRRERRCGGRRVGHARGMLDQAFDAAERLGEREQLRAGDEVDGLGFRLHQERDHAAEVAHLSARDLVAGVVREAGVEDALDAGVAVEELGDAPCVL